MKIQFEKKKATKDLKKSCHETDIKANILSLHLPLFNKRLACKDEGLTVPSCCLQFTV